MSARRELSEEIDDLDVTGLDLCPVLNAAGSWYVSEPTVRRACAAGRVRGAVKIGLQWRIPRAEIERVARVGLDAPTRRRRR